MNGALHLINLTLIPTDPIQTKQIPIKPIIGLIGVLSILLLHLKSKYDDKEMQMLNQNQELLTMSPRELMARLSTTAANVIEQTSHINPSSTFKYALPFFAIVVALAGLKAHWAELKSAFQSHLNRRHISVDHRNVKIPTSGLKAKFITMLKTIGIKSKSKSESRKSKSKSKSKQRPSKSKHRQSKSNSKRSKSKLRRI